MYLFKPLYSHRDNSPELNLGVKTATNAKSPLPVDVRRTKTSLLKFPTVSPPRMYVVPVNLHMR